MEKNTDINFALGVKAERLLTIPRCLLKNRFLNFAVLLLQLHCPHQHLDHSSSTTTNPSSIENLNSSGLLRNHATHLARGDRRTCQVELLRLAAERRAVPLHLVVRAAAGLRNPGQVDLGQCQPASELGTPATGPHHVDRRRGLPAPVFRAIALEDDADVDARKGQRKQAQQAENPLLTAAERAHILEQVIEGGHGAAGFQKASSNWD